MAEDAGLGVEGSSPDKTNDKSKGAKDCYDEKQAIECAALSDELFGRQLTCPELANLVGAYPDAEIKANCGVRYLRLNRYGYSKVDGLNIVVRHQFYETPQLRVIFRDSGGRLILYNEMFVVNKQEAPPHTGSRVLARSVNQLLRYNSKVDARYRIRLVKVHAFSRSDAFNGAYTWARLGYNARLADIDANLRVTLLEAVQDAEYSAELQAAIAEARTLNDLILIGGAELWRKYNQEFWGELDLNPDSDSVAILHRYISTKGIVL